MITIRPQTWRGDDPEPDHPMPTVRDCYGITWAPDERDDGFEGWRSTSHGLALWRTWSQLCLQRGPLVEWRVEAS